MCFIRVEGLCKTFKVLQRDSGLKNAFRSLIKRDYKYIKAVDNISFEIDEGEIVAYIGPNGAGKSTTIKMLTGILKPDSGNIKVSDFDPFSDRKKYVSNIGVVFGQKSQLWWDIPVIDSFDLLRDIYKIPKEEYEQTKNELIKMLDIKDFINTPVRQLSLGQRMRCEIAASLLHKPKILFLDEPTIGLDAVSKVQVRKFIKEINKKEKVTIILTSHDMSDIEALTNRVIVIGHGKKLYDGTLNGIKKKFSNKKKLEILFNKLNKIPKLKDVEIIEKKEHKIILDVDVNKNTISGIIEKFTKECEIQDVNVINEDIDSIIVKLYQDLEL
ncbi:MAG: ATP-binding cassette domain-containing protein [Bacilli bacterium]|nr:ATP-binding cassette domain-containing protein [Bacilli bacterium]